MDGIINLHKPTGITSAKALYRVRTLTGQRKSGHAGTLDPGASGVLLLCLGRATKLVERIMDQPKVYRATARLDVTSESYDSDRPLVPVKRGRGSGVGGRDGLPFTGYELEPAGDDTPGGLPNCQIATLPNSDLASSLHTIATSQNPTSGGLPGQSAIDIRHSTIHRLCPSENVPHREHVLQALLAFEGEIQQVPPSISAVKIAGQPAYKRKAGDAPLDLKPRAVRIYWIQLHSYDWPVIDFEMCCGRGTYVRALIRDLGQRLETGGCLTSLVRTRIGPFQIEEAWTLEAIAESSRQPLPFSGGGQGGGEVPRTSTMTSVSPYLIPLDEAARLLSPDALVIPPRL